MVKVSIQRVYASDRGENILVDIAQGNSIGIAKQECAMGLHQSLEQVELSDRQTEEHGVPGLIHLFVGSLNIVCGADEISELGLFDEAFFKRDKAGCVYEMMDYRIFIEAGELGNGLKGRID